MEPRGGEGKDRGLAQALLDAAPYALIATSMDGRVLSWNRGAQILFGRGPDEALGASLAELIVDGSQAAQVRHALGNANATGRAKLTTVSRRKDGSSILIDAALSRVDGPDSTPCVTVVVTPHTVEHGPEQVSDAQISSMLEAAPDAMVMVGPTGQIKVVNGQVTALLGYAKEELLGEPVEILIPERFRERHPGYRAGYFGDPHTRPMGATLELFGRRKGGTEFPAEISLAPMGTRDGVMVTAAIRDVTERRRAETKFRGLLEAVPDAIVIVDRFGTISARQRADREALRIHPRRDGRARGGDAHPGAFPVPSPAPSRRFLRRAARPRHGLEPRTLRPAQGRDRVPRRDQPEPTRDRRRTVVSAAIRDTSLRRKAEEKFRGLLESAPDAVVIVHGSGRIVLANSQTEKLFGYSRDELVGQWIEMLVPERFRRIHPRHRSRYFYAPRSVVLSAGATTEQCLLCHGPGADRRHRGRAQVGRATDGHHIVDSFRRRSHGLRSVFSERAGPKRCQPA